MIILSWQDISVQQFQDVYRLSISPDIDEMQRVERCIAILFNMSEQEVENLSVPDFNTMARQCGFVLTSEALPGKPVKHLKVGRHRYAINYDPTKLRHRQYVEVLHFGDKPIENMHLIMASLVQPVNWYGKKLKNNAEDHAAIASDLLNARVVDLYHTCVFFCKLYVSLIDHIKASLVVEMMKAGTTKDQALQLINSSQSVMAGFIQPGRWQNLRV